MCLSSSELVIYVCRLQIYIVVTTVKQHYANLFFVNRLPGDNLLCFEKNNYF